MYLQIVSIYLVISLHKLTVHGAQPLWPGNEKCSGNSAINLKYLSGDALTDSTDCLGPNNLPYPR